MGVWNHPVRKEQPSTNTRQHQNCSTTQRNKRSTTTIPTTPSRYSSAFCWCTWAAHSWVSQSKYSIFQDASPTRSTQHKCRFNRPTTNGHWFGVQRKRKAQGQRKELYTKDKVKERHDDTTKEKDTQDTTTVDMAKAKHKHQLVTAMRSKDQDTHRSKERQKAKDPFMARRQRKRQRSMPQMRTYGSHGKRLPCTSAQRGRSDRRTKHGPTTTTKTKTTTATATTTTTPATTTTTLLWWGAVQPTTVWPTLPTMEWARSMAVWATMVSRATGTRVHTTTSTNPATSTGSFFSEDWRTACSVSYTHRPQHGLNSSNHGWQWSSSACLFTKLWCRLPHYRHLHHWRHHHCAQFQMSHSRSLPTDGSGSTTDKENNW